MMQSNLCHKLAAIRWMSVLVFFYLVVNLMAVEPVVSNLRVTERQDGSKKVDVFYDVTTPDTTRLFTRMELTTDGTNAMHIPYKALSGDIGWIVPGIGKHIVWDISAPERNYEGSDYKIRLSVDNNHNLATNKRYVCVGNADFFAEDYSIIMPLLRNYNFTQTFYVQTNPRNNNPNLSSYATNELDQVFVQNSVLGDHTFAHYGPFTSFPFADGYTSPSDSELTQNRGDGRNAFGILLTATVGSIVLPTYLYTRGAAYDNVTFGNLTHQQCDDIRTSISVFRRPTSFYQGGYVRLLESLDYLSNRYLGTTGTGRNIVTPGIGTNLPIYGDSVIYDANHRIAGGIFQGCSSTANHECWERIVKLHSLFHSNLLNRNLHSKGWFSSGGIYNIFLYRGNGTNLYQGGTCYMDAAHNYLASAYTKIPSSRLGISRSLYDVLYAEGYRTGFEAGLPIGSTDGRNITHFFIPNKLNSGSFTPNYDCLCTNIGRINRYYTGENGFTDAELQTRNIAPNKLRWLYDRDKALHSNDNVGFYLAANNIIQSTTWGTIPKYADDSGQGYGPYYLAKRNMLGIQIDTFFNFCYKAGIQVISYEEAVELASQTLPAGTNLFPNPYFVKTIDDLIGSFANPQIIPDGWLCSTNNAMQTFYDNTLHADCVSLNSGTNGHIKQYMIAPGTLSLTFKAKGTGTLIVYGMLNKTVAPTNSAPPYPTVLATIPINSTLWTDYSANISIPIVQGPVTPAYDYCQGRENQICGIDIQLTAASNPSGVQLSLPALVQQ